MLHVLLWINIIAFTSLFAAFFIGLKESLILLNGWVKYNYFYILGLSVWVLIATLDDYAEIFIRHGTVLENQIDALIMLIAVSAIVYSYFHFMERLFFPGERRTAILAATGSIFGYVIVFVLLIAFQQPYAETFLCLVGFFGLFVLSVSVVVRVRAWRTDRQKRAYLPLVVANLIFFPAYLAEYLICHFRPATLSFSTTGMFTISAYCLAVSALTIIRSLRRPLSPGGEPGSDVPVAFMEEYGVTEREKEIIVCLLRGYSSKKIGETLFIARRTVGNHLQNIYRKCDVQGRLDLVRLLREYSV
jgi:DNA-binding CsgD family transcriptional regulator